jgi:hypothetical protein
MRPRPVTTDFLLSSSLLKRVGYSHAAAERRIPKRLSPLDNPGKEFIYRDWVIGYAYVRLRSGRAEGEL